MSCLARIRANTHALPPSTNRLPPSQHQYASSGHAAHQRVHSHSHSQGTPASPRPHQASQSGANANARDIRGAQPPHTTQLQQYAMHGLSDLVDNLPLCLLASRVVARGNKPADIVISPRNSDAGASLNQSGPGTCRRQRRLVATSLCSPRLTVY